MCQTLSIPEIKIQQILEYNVVQTSGSSTVRTVLTTVTAEKTQLGMFYTVLFKLSTVVMRAAQWTAGGKIITGCGVQCDIIDPLSAFTLTGRAGGTGWLS